MTGSRTTICPRCGYDLAGVIDSWTDHCPMGGTCSECGHEFEWVAIFDAARSDVPWLVEHGFTRRDWLGRGFKTWWRLTRPRRFWREVGVDSRIKLRPLIAWVVGLMLLSQVVTVATAVAGGIRSWLAWSGVNRTMGISTGEIALQMFVRDLFSPIVEIDYWPPWTVNGVYMSRGGPMEEMVLLGSYALAFPLMMMVLPVTRSRANLRPAHLIRACLYGLGIVASVRILSMFGRAAMWNISAPWTGHEGFSLIVGVSGLVWLSWWWLSALTAGWRVQNAWLVWVLLTVASILAGPAVAIFLAYLVRFILF